MTNLPPPSITSRPQFEEELEQALVLADDRLADNPGWNAIAVLRRQLQAMKSWTADARTPTQAERDKIQIGAIAMRELDDDPNDRLAELCLRLNYFFKEWPLPPGQ